jgi:hypothetical protein
VKDVALGRTDGRLEAAEMRYAAGYDTRKGVTIGPQLVMRRLDKQIHDRKKHRLEHLLGMPPEKKTPKQMLYSELLCFWTLSITGIQNTRKRNVSETGPVSILT